MKAHHVAGAVTGGVFTLVGMIAFDMPWWQTFVLLVIAATGDVISETLAEGAS